VTRRLRPKSKRVEYPKLTAPLADRVYIGIRAYDPEHQKAMLVKGTGIRLEYIPADEVIAILQAIAPPAPVRRFNVNIAAYNSRGQLKTVKTLSFEGFELAELREEIIRRLREAAKSDVPVTEGLGLG
jgi:hypothetical protein